jgi:hypothetical protein
MWGQPPSAVQERSSVGFDSKATEAVGPKVFEKLERSYSKMGIAFLVGKSSFARPDSRGRLSPQDQLPHQVTIAIFNRLPTLNGNLIGGGAVCVK